MRKITVAVTEPYEVHIGDGALLGLGEMVGHRPRRVVVCHTDSVAHMTSSAMESLEAARHETSMVLMPDAEEAKTLDSMARLWDTLAELGVGRDAALVSIGGGALTDAVGFAAATWLRGVDHYTAPTTVLGMVDAGVGGKTAINTAAGKNLVGAFHHPRGVLCDTLALPTMETADVAAGLAEVIKCGFIADPSILDLLEGAPGAALDTSWSGLHDVIAGGVQVKADVVARDFKEAGPREALNFGHTFAHAIEKCEGYRWRHGDAVAVGMLFAAHLWHQQCVVGEGDAVVAQDICRRLEGILTSHELPTRYEGAATFDDLLSVMLRDKKVKAGQLRFVVVPDAGSTTRLSAPSVGLLRAAHSAVTHSIG